MVSCRQRPDARLSAFIEDYWLYDGYVSAHERERILPSGTFELVFYLREDELRIYGAAHGGSCRRFSGAVISGPYAGYFGSDAREEVSIMGVHFRVGGAFPFLGMPAGELADAHVDLSELWRAEAGRLRTQLIDAATPGERFRLLEEALLRRIRRPLVHHGAVSHALQLFKDPGTAGGTGRLARAVGLSERRFIEVFRAEVGMTPKLFDRVRRFQQAMRAANGSDVVDWSELALSCGYFDQSHLIRDFKQFTGITPGDYLRRLGELRASGAHTKPNHLAIAE